MRRWATKPRWSVLGMRGKEDEKMETTDRNKNKKDQTFSTPFQHAVNKMSSAYNQL